MGENGAPRRRNLRPRAHFSAEDFGVPPKRTLRRSRAKLSAGDFLVFDNDEDLDFDANVVAAEEEEEEEEEEEPLREPTSSSRRASSRSSRSARSTRSSTSQKRKHHEREISRPTTRDRTRRRESRRRRARAIDDEEELSEAEADIFEAMDEDGLTEEEDENGYGSDDDDGLGPAPSSRRRASGRSRNRNRQRKAKTPLPEDVPGRPLHPSQPPQDPEDVAHAPSVAFLAIFVATFIDLFPDLSVLPAPQDIEEGLVSEQPSELVELIFRRLLGLVLNRKKEIEPGRYGSALSELHSLRGVLGQGSMFPPLNWKSRSNAFAELNWMDRLELLHVLVHWSLTASERVRQILKNLGEEMTAPWMGADEAGNHYYIVGFDPLAEGSQEHTRFRVYVESNRLLATVKWEPIASSAWEIVQFLRSREISTTGVSKPENSNGGPASGPQDNDEHTGGDENGKMDVDLETGPAAGATPAEGASGTAGGEAAGDADAEADAEAATEAHAGQNGEASAEEPAEKPPVKYDLPDTVVEILQSFLPLMQVSEQITSDRLEREAKRARRKRDIQTHSEAVARGEGRYSGRFRRRRTDYSEYLRQTYGGVSDDDEGEQLSSRDRRRLRHRRDDLAWQEPEPETREQRHARLLAERAERENGSRQVSETPFDDATPASSEEPHLTAEKDSWSASPVRGAANTALLPDTSEMSLTGQPQVAAAPAAELETEGAFAQRASGPENTSPPNAPAWSLESPRPLETHGEGEAAQHQPVAAYNHGSGLVPPGPEAAATPAFAGLAGQIPYSTHPGHVPSQLPPPHQQNVAQYVPLGGLGQSNSAPPGLEPTDAQPRSQFPQPPPSQYPSSQFSQQPPSLQPPPGQLLQQPPSQFLPQLPSQISQQQQQQQQHPHIDAPPPDGFPPVNPQPGSAPAQQPHFDLQNVPQPHFTPAGIQLAPPHVAHFGPPGSDSAGAQHQQPGAIQKAAEERSLNASEWQESHGGPNDQQAS